MKLKIGTISLLLFILAFFMMIAACFNPWRGEEATGTLIIMLGGGTSRVTIEYPPDNDIIDKLEHRITFTGTAVFPHENPIIIPTSQFQTQVQVTNLPVNSVWNIKIDALLSNNPYAQGTINNITISSGSNAVTINMNPVFPDAGADKVWLESRDNNLTSSYLDLNAALVQGNLNNGTNFIVWIIESHSSNPIAIPSDKNITLRPVSSDVTITLNNDGSLFTVDTDTTLTLTNGINLVGVQNNNVSLIRVNDGIFNMDGGSISGNENTTGNGGGVYVNGGSFAMRGGTIFGNTTVNRGGGVYVDLNGSFTKTSGGIIYGLNETDINLKNTAVFEGHAVYAVYDNILGYDLFRAKNNTAGSSDSLDSQLSIADGGGWDSEDP